MSTSDKITLKVQVVIYHPKTEEFLILQTNERRGGFWQNVTGSVESNENILDAARRELIEETSLEIDDIRILDIEFKFEDQWKRSVQEKCFLAKVKSKGVLLDPFEHQSFIWKKKNQISKETYKYSSNFECFLKSLERI
ncbi:MAG: NUDIX domain-containing protein [Halobacteriovoraceae bacterium]|nr:NUDIX domain-containing protein [Halobacteriovoraceae bacterium]